MAKWEIEVIFEPTGDYMNFIYETDTEDEDAILTRYQTNYQSYLT